MGFDGHLGIDPFDRGRGAFHLGPPDVVGPVNHLTLQVGKIDDIVIDYAECPDPGGR